jgi:uncharacterized protein YyaL (SSP411 family)
MPNRLAHENSPYLLQHKNNPVDWYPWGKEALEKARTENKPIFLSIGYAACHWCHVMEHESFEDEGTAALMNNLFVNIKVDREQRPDLDNIYMKAVVAMTGQGGWPMSVFLTPEGEPFYGGTYFPPERRYNMPAFQEVLQAVADAWQQDRQGIGEQAGRLKEHIAREFSGFAGEGRSLDASVTDQAAMKLAQNYDWRHGGWGKAPKFPQPMAIEFMLQRSTRGDKMALDMAVHALRAMARGGMYDVVGGGFARYSVDDFWLVPHFEKMLYDNAQLACTYLQAWMLTKEPALRQVAEETLNFVARELAHPDGGFYSSLDADSEGEEGRFYVWSPSEIQAALPNDQAALVIAAYGVSEKGNFEGKNVLQRAVDDQALAEQFKIPIEAVPERLSAAHQLLLAERTGRVRPGTDDKVLTAWNGLMLRAFAEAGRYLKAPVYIDLAIRNGDFLLQNLRRPDGRLLRAWRDGQAAHLAYLEDYGGLILGLLALYQSDPDPRWFAAARQLADKMLALFSDPEGGFYDTGDDHEQLLVRPRDLQDNATPSGASLAVRALLALAAYSGDGAYRQAAESALTPIGRLLAQYPTAFANWLCAYDFALGPVDEVAILGAETEGLTGVLWETYRPRQVAAISAFPPAGDAPELLLDRPLQDGRATAYVCRGFVCQQPVNTPEALRLELS